MSSLSRRGAGRFSRKETELTTSQLTIVARTTETEQKRDLEDLLAKFDIAEICSSSSQKQSFCTMFNHVFDPPLPLKQIRSSQPETNNNNNNNNPAIVAFQAVFKAHFRRNPYIDWAAAKAEAVANFDMAVVAANMNMNRIPLAQLSTSTVLHDLKRQVGVELSWLKNVNEWKRNNFQSSATEEGVRKFRLLLWDKYPVGSLKTSCSIHAEADVRKYSGDLMTQIMADFKGEIPAFEQDTEPTVQWSVKLRKACSEVEEEALARNRRNREWAQRSGPALNQLKELMSGYFESNPFVEVGKARKCHFEAAGKCVEKHGLTGFLKIDGSMMKMDWEERIWNEFWTLQKRWKATGDARICKFEAALKVKVERMIKKEFNLMSGVVKVGSLFAENFAEVLRRDLEKVGEIEVEDRGGSESNWEDSGSQESNNDDDSRRDKSGGDESSDEEGDSDFDTGDKIKWGGFETSPAKDDDGCDKDHGGSSKRHMMDEAEEECSIRNIKKIKLEPC